MLDKSRFDETDRQKEFKFTLIQVTISLMKVLVLALGLYFSNYVPPSIAHCPLRAGVDPGSNPGPLTPGTLIDEVVTSSFGIQYSV